MTIDTESPKKINIQSRSSFGPFEDPHQSRCISDSEASHQSQSSGNGFPAVFDTDSAASYLSLSKTLLARMRMSNSPPEWPPGPKYFRVGRAVRYTRKALNDFIAARQAEERS